MKILVAEDHENTRETYKLMLEAEGHDVVVTNNGQDCIAEYNASLNDDSRHFDLLILDYRLPLRDGMEIARQVLSIVPKQRILIASAYPEDIISKSADGLQCNLELMVKPFDIIEFVDVVNKAKSPAMLVS